MALVIGWKVYVAWKSKMLHDVIGGHQAYIHEKIDLWRIEFCSWLRPRAVSRLRVQRDDNVATLSARSAELRSELMDIRRLDLVKNWKNVESWGVLIKRFTPNVLNCLQNQSSYCIAKYYVRVFLGLKMLLPMFYN